jgi:Cu/Ag efflux pump CusA
VAAVEVGENLAEIRHESVITYLDVLAAVEGRAVGDVAEEVQRVIAGVDFPREYHAALLGGFEERQAQTLLVWSVGVGAALFVVLLLQAALNSWRLAIGALVVVAIPMSTALIAIWITSGVARIGAMAGLFAVFGFAVRRVVVLVRHYHYLHRVEGIPFGVDLVVRGTRDRIAPMLTSSTAGIVFLLPFAVQGETLGLEIMQPMAVAVIGGLLGAVAMSLTAVPVLYRVMARPEDTSTWGQELLATSSLEGDEAGDGHVAGRVE